ncbi:hypothetical protein T4A_10047 [Trichinella pseudospiralis]|uniref:Uncharacterized protein n=1 Tax=Trichinella pseudospiralis TaxID=6337 RepID=A0A0V1DZ45_TRIPS|nr:hypothetical protein T4A_10047 [Trichinella pseudospiralis]
MLVSVGCDTLIEHHGAFNIKEKTLKTFDYVMQYRWKIFFKNLNPFSIAQLGGRKTIDFNLVEAVLSKPKCQLSKSIAKFCIVYSLFLQKMVFKKQDKVDNSLPLADIHSTSCHSNSRCASSTNFNHCIRLSGLIDPSLTTLT